MALFMALNHAQSNLNVTDDSMEISSDAGHHADEEDTLIDIDIEVDAPYADADATDERMEDDLEDNPDDLMDDGDRDDATNEEIMDDYHVEDEEEDLDLQDLQNEDLPLDSHDLVDFQTQEYIANDTMRADANHSSFIETNELHDIPFPDPLHSDNDQSTGNLDKPIARDSHLSQDEPEDLHDGEEAAVNEEFDVVNESVRHEVEDSNDRQNFEADDQPPAALPSYAQSKANQAISDKQAGSIDFNNHQTTDVAATQGEIPPAHAQFSRPFKAPPLKVIWDGYEFDPFAPDDPLVPFQDLDIAEKPLPQFIGALRNMLRDQIDEDFELEIDFRQLDLSLRENTPDSSCSLIDINEIYVSLCNNDGNFEQAPLEIALIARAPFALRYQQLHEAHSSGQGLNTLFPDSDSDVQTTYHEEAVPYMKDDNAAETLKVADEGASEDDELRPDEVHPPDLTESSIDAVQGDKIDEVAHGETGNVESVPQILDFADDLRETGTASQALVQDDELKRDEEGIIDSRGADEEKAGEEQDYIDYSDEELTDDQAGINGSSEEKDKNVDHRDPVSVSLGVPDEEEQDDEVGETAAQEEAINMTQQAVVDDEAHGFDEQFEDAYEVEAEVQFIDHETEAGPTEDAEYDAVDTATEDYEPEDTTEYFDATADAEEEIDYDDGATEAEYVEHDDDDLALLDTVTIESEHTQTDDNGNVHGVSVALEGSQEIGDDPGTTSTTSIATKLSPSSNEKTSTLSRKRSFSQREADGETHVTNDQKKSRAS